MTDWRTAAACRPENKPADMSMADWVNQWFPPDAKGRPPAVRKRMDVSGQAGRLICSTCPVQSKCIQDAVDNGEKHGLRGGVSYKKRRGIPKSETRPCRRCRTMFTNKDRRVAYCSEPCRNRARQEGIAQWASSRPLKGDQRNVCPVCGFESRTPGGLQLHRRIHKAAA